MAVELNVLQQWTPQLVNSLYRTLDTIEYRRELYWKSCFGIFMMNSLHAALTKTSEGNFRTPKAISLVLLSGLNFGSHQCRSV